jgi:hypothetical protein
MPEAETAASKEQSGASMLRKGYTFHFILSETQTYIQIRLLKCQGKIRTKPVVEGRDEERGEVFLAFRLAGNKGESLAFQGVKKTAQLLLDMVMLLDELDIIDDESRAGGECAVGEFRRALEKRQKFPPGKRKDGTGDVFLEFKSGGPKEMAFSRAGSAVQEYGARREAERPAEYLDGFLVLATGKKVFKRSGFACCFSFLHSSGQ